MRGKPDIQEIATSYIIGDHIVEVVCSKTGLPRTVAKDIQVKIMSTGKMHFALPREITGELTAKAQERIKQSPRKVLHQKYTYGALKDEVFKKATDKSKPGVEILADFIKEYSFTTKGKPPRDKKILLSIDTLSLHGKAIQELCKKLLTHRNSMLQNSIDARNKGGRAVINALAVESLELLEEYGEEKFREAASNLLSKKGNTGQSKGSLKDLIVNVLSACVPKANVAGLRKRLQRLRRSKK